MFAFTRMNQTMAAAARSAAGFDARSASVFAVIMDAIILASIFVALSLSVVLPVLPIILVLVRIISWLVIPTPDNTPLALPQI